MYSNNNFNSNLILFLILILIINILFLFIIKLQKNNNIERFITKDCEGWDKEGSDDFCNTNDGNKYICFLRRIFCYIENLKSKLTKERNGLSKCEDNKIKEIDELQHRKDEEIKDLRYNCPDYTYSPVYYDYVSENPGDNSCDFNKNDKYICSHEKNNLISKLEKDNKLIKIDRDTAIIEDIDGPNKCLLKYNYSLNKYYDLTLIDPDISNTILNSDNPIDNEVETIFTLTGSQSQMEDKCIYEPVITQTKMKERLEIFNCNDKDYTDLLNDNNLRYINNDCVYDNIDADPKKWVYYNSELTPQERTLLFDKKIFKKITLDKTELTNEDFDENSENIEELKTKNFVLGGDNLYYKPLLSKYEAENIDNRILASPLVWIIQETNPYTDDNYGRFLNNRIQNFVRHCEEYFITYGNTNEIDILQSKWDHVNNNSTLGENNLYIGDYIVIKHYNNLYYITPKNNK